MHYRVAQSNSAFDLAPGAGHVAACACLIKLTTTKTTKTV
jgi:hypothetical protein